MSPWKFWDLCFQSSKSAFPPPPPFQEKRDGKYTHIITVLVMKLSKILKNKDFNFNKFEVWGKTLYKMTFTIFFPFLKYIM